MNGLFGFDPGHQHHVNSQDSYLRQLLQAQQNAAQYQQIAQSAAASYPVPNPEPNKVLLLLGDDE